MIGMICGEPQLVTVILCAVRSSGLVELTNPEGQTYTAGRLSNEERAQKILRCVYFQAESFLHL